LFHRSVFPPDDWNTTIVVSNVILTLLVNYLLCKQNLSRDKKNNKDFVHLIKALSARSNEYRLPITH
jgi:hypothetical protein